MLHVKQRLLEYSAQQFFKDCTFDSKDKQKCIKIGFRFGQHDFQKLDTWLNSNDFTDQDFIRKVFELNDEENLMSETQLLSTLSRFLCGYDKQVACRPRALELPEDERGRYFQNQRDFVDVTDDELKAKEDFILETLET